MPDYCDGDDSDDYCEEDSINDDQINGLVLVLVFVLVHFNSINDDQRNDNVLVLVIVLV